MIQQITTTIKLNIMKNLLLSIVIIGMLFLCISLLLTNVYILGFSEILVIVPTIFLIKLNLKKL